VNRAYAWVFVALLYAPIALIVLFSFHSSAALTFPFQGFSLRWYQELFAQEAMLAALKNSLLVGTVSTLATTVIGSLAALAFVRLRGRATKIASVLGFAPIALPGLFLGVGLLIFFSQLGLQRSLFTVTLGHILITVPFFIEVSRSRLAHFDISVEEAARDLGATPLQTFRLVTLPIIAPTLLGAAILSFAISLDEIIVTVFISGNQSTVPLMIMSMLRREVSPLTNAISVISIGLVMATMILGSLALFLRKRSVIAYRTKR
jgi:spermidine/putrescine transport system permease protein